MNNTHETTLDFDNTVTTEERFEMRKFINNFIVSVNDKNQYDVEDDIADGFVAQGISEFIMQKPQLVGTLYRKFFGRKNNYMWFPKLKLTKNKNLFYLYGTYEEYQQGILSTEGDIEMKVTYDSDGKFQFVSWNFFPRMRMVE